MFLIFSTTPLYLCISCMFTQDQVYLVKKLSLPITNLDVVANKAKGNATVDVTQQLFKELNKSQVQGLFNLYERDFMLFGYNIEPYLSLASMD